MPAGLLLVLLVLISLYPLAPVDSWQQVLAAWRSGLSLSLPNDPVTTFAQRALLLFPLGFALHRCGSRRGLATPFATAVVLVAAMSLVIELLQPALSVRHARLSDLLVSISMGALGAACASLLRYGALLPGGLLLVLNLLLAWLLVVGHLGVGLDGWDCEAPLLIGNENTLDRPWVGRVGGVALYPQGLDREAAARLADLPWDPAGYAARQSMGAAVVITPDPLLGGFHVQVAAGLDGFEMLAVPEGSVQMDGGWPATGGEVELYRSDRPLPSLCGRMRANGGFAVEAWVEGLAAQQNGPARIVSLSTGPRRRDFTLGEEYGRVDLRVQMPRRGDNGSNIPFMSTASVLEGGRHHLLASYQGGLAQLFVDGSQARPPRYYQSVFHIGWLRWIRIEWVLLLAGILGGVLAWRTFPADSVPWRVGAGLVAVAGVPLALDMLLGAVLTQKLDPAVGLTLSLAALLGLALGWSMTRYPDGSAGNEETVE